MQQGGGSGGHQSQYGEMGGGPTTDATSSSHMVSEQSEQLEEASPISYRPPAAAIGNPDELMMRLAEEGDEGDRLGDDHGCVGGGAGGVASGNRWPRQETLALLKIRSDMDGIFRDATVKGPLWEDVSRKLAELGYKRSAKKCKEKFENVHKYYKRTKDGRGGRQDGKSYKFFSELEALNTTSATLSKPPITPATSASLDVAPISIGIPMPISSVRIPPTTTTTTAIPMSSSMLPMPGSAPPPPPATPFGISFSSNSSSSSQGFEDEDEIWREPSTDMGGTSRKRKRQSSSREGGSSSSRKRMMEFFEGLMKQVMQKQEALQQTFLESIEKREQDRMIREEAWKRQEMARLAREHELIAQERAIASSRDAAIISFLQKITGQTIQLPTTVSTIPSVTIPSVPPPPTQPATPVVQPPTPIPTAAPPLHHPPSLPQQKSHLHHQQQQQAQNTQLLVKHNQQQEPIPSEVIMAIPEQKVPPQEIGGSEGIEPASSRWPKAEVLALINLRSGLETRYQEAGPKGPLWEEISVGMSRMGYKRSAKRCKEKWENINKYFKKVKESNKKRPEDAKTCPYFHQLDALYRKKILGSGSSSFSDQNRLEGETSQQHQDPPMEAPQPSHDQSENKTGTTIDVLTSKENSPGSLFGKGNGRATKKSEDIVRKLMEEQEMQMQ
ncbi:Trihelix transcription factor GTL1 -like protein [Gossypium arboreum]|uniref:Trihelix transcription factor GTL1-like protein n=1 Tax=Gossypium arboreum TaxID=29729 RepID=A0A0B0N0U8_GOSAR|nr:trihelix transcription factor GTL1-like [Gossypium arboreum]KHG05349.1 Trihelix transcription factor GTL1 -like protein [Gossypium arboreum]